MRTKFVTDFGKKALIFKDREYTYKEVIRESKYISSLLNLNKNDKVIIFMENRPEFITSFFGTWNGQGLPINLDSGYNHEELEYVIYDANPKYILTSTRNLSITKKACENHPNVKIFNVDEICLPTNFTINEDFIYSPEPHEAGVLLYTSGTTGNPKGVILTFDNLASNVEAITEIKLASPEDRVLALLPYHHVMPLSINLLMAIHIGTLVVIIDELSASSILGALQKHKITIVLGVPRLWEMIHKGLIGKIKGSKLASLLFNICKKINSPSLSKVIFKKVHEALGGNLRYFLSGGAKLEQGIIEDFHVLGIEVIEGYGLTETSPIVTFTRPGDIKIGTTGKTIPGVEIKLTEEGEILVRGRNVFKEYYNKPEATKEVKDNDGWFSTGDLGKIEDGYLSIVGRKKEMIVLSNGKNINPSDIESTIIKATDIIKEVAVMEYNNHLLALVYPDFEVIKRKNIVNIVETLKWEIIDSYNATAPNYKKILEIKVTKEELPKTKLGKLRRFMLKDILKDIEEGRDKKKEVIKDESYETQEFKTLASYMITEKNLDISPTDHLEIDLGLDSLDLIQLTSFIEKTFGLEIKEEDAVNLKVIKDICEYIKEHSTFYNPDKMNWSEILKEDIDFTLPNSRGIWLSKLFFYPLMKFYLKVKVKNKEKLSPEPRIIICNHESFIDAFILQQIFNKTQEKDIYYFAIKKHFDYPIIRQLPQYGNIVLMDINEGLKESLQISAKILRENKSLVIFPEGARTRNGNLQDFKKFFAILSHELNIPITVLGLDGAYRAMPYGAKWIKPSNLLVEVLGEVKPDNKSVDEIVESSQELIKNWKDNL